MEKLLIGKYVNTHGIKGEIRIKSDFKYKNKIFNKGSKLYINDHEYIITSYRVHKNYDMVTLEGIDDIEKILKLKGSLVYINKENLILNDDEYLDIDLIGIDVVIKDEIKGQVEDILYLPNNKKLLKVNSHYIPFELIILLDKENRRIEVEEVEGLI